MKCVILHWSVGGVLISLPKALSPWVVIPLLSVTHGQCDARPRDVSSDTIENALENDKLNIGLNKKKSSGWH